MDGAQDTLSTDQGGGGMVPILAGSQRTGSANWWTSNTWGGGSGQMAIRGAVALSLKLQRLALGQQVLAQRTQQAMSVFEQTSPSGVGDVLTFNPDPRAKAIAQAIQQVQGLLSVAKSRRQAKKLMRREATLQRKLATRELATAGETQVRVSEAFGPNAGYWREWGAPAPLFLTGGIPL